MHGRAECLEALSAGHTHRAEEHVSKSLGQRPSLAARASRVARPRRHQHHLHDVRHDGRHAVQVHRVHRVRRRVRAHARLDALHALHDDAHEVHAALVTALVYGLVERARAPADDLRELLHEGKGQHRARTWCEGQV